MSPGQGFAVAVTIVAAPVVAEDLWLSRRGHPMISHHWWTAVEDVRLRPVAAGIWASLTYHLWRPRRSWWEACTVGTASGLTLAAIPRVVHWVGSGARIP